MVQWSKGGGIFESNSNNATIVHNLIFNPSGAALYLSGVELPGPGNCSTGNCLRYNCRQVDGEGGTGTGGEACAGPLSADNVAWLSYGCGLPPTNSTTNKNYLATGNIFLGLEPISIGECDNAAKWRVTLVCRRMKAVTCGLSLHCRLHAKRCGELRVPQNGWPRLL